MKFRRNQEVPMGLLIGWTVLSLAIGLLARQRGDSFFIGFLCSMTMSPLVGFAMTMLKLPRHPKAQRGRASVTARA
jgi:hypothetical protein